MNRIADLGVSHGLRDNLKSVWCATSHIYRKSESWPTMQRRSKFGRTMEAEREAVNFYATLQVNRALRKPEVCGSRAISSRRPTMEL